MTNTQARGSEPVPTGEAPGGTGLPREQTSPPEDYGRETIDRLQATFGAEAIKNPYHFRGDWCIDVPVERLHDVAQFLKKDCGYLMLSSMSGVDHYPDEPRFRVVYMLTHMQKKNQFRFQVYLGGEDPHVPTVSDVWAVANWQEREVFDFFGILFDNHPDLRRVLMPEDFEGFPLRKDFPLLGVDVGLKARS
jgi:NADH-quinone oxidoreductase subunit C